MELLDKLNFLVNKYKNLSPRAQKVVRLAAKKTALLHGVRRAKRNKSNLVKAAKAKKIADAVYLPSLSEIAGFRLGPFSGIYKSATNAYHKYKNDPDAYDNVYDLYADAITDYTNFRNNIRSIAQRARRTNLSNSNNRNTATNLNINSNRGNSAVVNRRKANGSSNNYIPPTATSSIPGNYTILNGDTLSSIAANNGMTVDEILALNPNILNANRIYAGNTLNLGSSDITDRVRKGELIDNTPITYGKQETTIPDYTTNFSNWYTDSYLPAIKLSLNNDKLQYDLLYRPNLTRYINFDNNLLANNNISNTGLNGINWEEVKNKALELFANK